MAGAPKFSDMVSPVLSGGVALRIKVALAVDLKECGLSRDEVAYQLTRQAERNVTVTQIDAYVAETKPHRIPVEMVPAWVRVTGSRRVLDLLCEEAGLICATQKERELAELGLAHLEAEKAAARLQSIRGQICHGT